MAGIKTNAVKLDRRLKAYSRILSDNVEEVVSGAAVIAVDNLFTVTPVDTGAAQSHWQVAPRGGSVPEFDEELILTRSEVRAKAKAATATPRREYVVRNPTPYLARLDAGSSTQAPAGFIRRTKDRVRAAVRKTRLLKRGGGKIDGS